MKMKHKHHNASTSNPKEPDEAPKENGEKNGINKRIQSETKRLQSLKNMIKGHQIQKSVIKAALSNVDSASRNKNNKIIFNDDDEQEPSEENNSATSASKKPSLDLFGSEGDASDVDDLKVDEKIESATTKEIWDLQKKFQNDERFKLSKFKSLYKDKEDDKEPSNNAEQGSSLEDEKQKQFQILEQVLGSKVESRSINKSNVQLKGMSRFDPSQPESKKYEIDNAKLVNESSKKKKKEKLQKEVMEVTEPVVSRVSFHKVSEDLKFTGGTEQFSLLSAYGVADEEHKEKEPYHVEVKKGTSGFESNPFPYDSSSEEEIEEPEESKKVESEMVEMTKNRVAAGAGQSAMFPEPFFFKDDDFRLQDGLDFMKRVEVDEQQQFGKLRRDLKKIVKLKVKNNQRKNKPFKKKLGGNKRKKIIKIKKALKR